MSFTKIAMALGSTLGAHQMLRSIQGFGVDDVLGSVGLERRRSTLDKVLPAVGYVGLGTVIGAGAALLLAPSSGKELRDKVSHQLDEAKSRIDQGIRTMEEAAPQRVHSNGGNG